MPEKPGLAIVFAKPPRPGEVKTRLVPAIGQNGAAMLARAFVADTWAQVSALPWARPVLATNTRLPYGDQAMFVRASVFRELGGFPAMPLLEDLEFARRLRRVGTIRTVPAVVRVSGRRFLARPVYFALVMLLFPLLYRLGVPVRILARLYGNPR